MAIIRTSLGLCGECLRDRDGMGICECAVDMRVCDACGGGPMGDSDPDLCPDCRVALNG